MKASGLFLRLLQRLIVILEKAEKKYTGKQEKKIMKKEEACFTNRELSWLQFNERVLNEAGNAKVPLAERLTFASIYQGNLDEFFRVRVGTLMMQMNSKEPVRENKTGMTSEEQVREILKEQKERGAICIIACHDAEELEYLSDEIIRISDGRIEQ